MLILKTTFHLRQDLPWNVVYEDCFLKWLSNSINRDTKEALYKKLLSCLPQQLDLNLEEEHSFASDTESLQISNFNYNGEQFLGFVFFYYNDNRKWDLRTVLKRTDKNVLCSVSLSCEVLKNQGIPSILKPRIIDYLLKYQAGDGDIDISNKPHILQNVCYNEAINLLTGQKKNKLPFVYLSCSGQNHALRPSEVAKKLYGIAHVYAEEDIHVGERLSMDLKTPFPHKGEIGICYPTHPIITINRTADETWLESPEILVQDIFRKILRQNLASKSEFSWDDFQIAQVKRYQERIRTEKNDKAQYETLLNQISKLEESIEELKIQLKTANEEKDTYFNMAVEADESCTSAKNKYHEETIARKAAENALEQYKNKSGVSISLNCPSDKEKYEGETQAIIICALKRLFETLDRRMTPRFYDVCDGLLSANNKAVLSYKNICDKIDEIAKIAREQNLKSSKGQQVLSKLNMVHIHNKGKNHGQIMYSNDDRYIAVEPCSGSDYRGGLNEEAEIRNKFFFKET